MGKNMAKLDARGNHSPGVDPLQSWSAMSTWETNKKKGATSSAHYKPTRRKHPLHRRHKRAREVSVFRDKMEGVTCNMRVGDWGKGGWHCYDALQVSRLATSFCVELQKPCGCWWQQHFKQDRNKKKISFFFLDYALCRTRRCSADLMLSVLSIACSRY